MKKDTETITLADALAELRQVHGSSAAERRKAVDTIMASHGEIANGEADQKKKRIQDMKNKTPCFSCGKNGHWFKERKYFLNSVQNKISQHRDTNVGLHPPIFRHGNQ